MVFVMEKFAETNLICPQGEAQCHYLSEIVMLRNEVKGLAELVRTDALTNLYNYRFFKETIDIEMERTRRGGQPLSIILLDVDFFKKFNDTWGHEAGNQALLHVANIIKLAIRKLDYPCRFGGEEFIVILPNTDIRQAISVAERIRQELATTSMSLIAEQTLNITASLGVDQFVSYNNETSDAFVSRVDAWLYQAKHAGRNRVAHPPLANVIKQESVSVEEKEALLNLHL
jgi:diguanylate cyclase (GGDEF)-like protein